MSNKLITALKENKNDIRKKLVIVGSVVVATVVAGVVLTRIAAERENVILVLEEATEAVTDATTE